VHDPRDVRERRRERAQEPDEPERPSVAASRPKPANDGRGPRSQPRIGGPSDAYPIGPETASRIGRLRGAGSPLPRASRGDLEAASGRDLGDVRIHANHESDRLAREVGAAAFTSGTDVFFRRNRFDPSSSSGRSLLDHEVGHVVGPPAPASVVLRQPEPEEEEEEEEGLPKPQELPHEVPETPAEVIDNALVDLENQIQAKEEDEPLEAAKLERQLLLVQYAAQPGLPSVDAAEDWVVKCGEDSKGEDATLGLLGKQRDWALRQYPRAFPEWWGNEVKRRLDLGIDPAQLQAQVTEAWNSLQSFGEQVPPYVVQEGLPLDYDQALAVQKFELSALYAKLSDPHAVKDYAKAAIAYRNTAYRNGFVFPWTMFVNNLVRGIKAGTTVVDPAEIDRLVGSTSRLGAMARSGGSPDEDAFRELDAELVNMREATFLVAVVGLFQSMKTATDLWKQAADLFLQKMAEADAQIKGAGFFDKISKAFWWAFSRGYFAGAAMALAAGIMHMDITEVVGKILLFVGLQAVPGVDILVDLYLLWEVGSDFISAMIDLASAFKDAGEANTVIDLQRASARLAKALVADPLRALVDWLGIKGSMAMLEEKAVRYQIADPTLSRKDALQRALKEPEGAIEPAEGGLATVVEEPVAAPLAPVEVTATEMLERQAARAAEKEAKITPEIAADIEAGAKFGGGLPRWTLQDLTMLAEHYAEEGMARWIRSAKRMNRIHPMTKDQMIKVFGKDAGEECWKIVTPTTRGVHWQGQIFIQRELEIEAASSTLVHEVTHLIQERTFPGFTDTFESEFQAISMQQRYVQRMPANQVADRDKWLLTADATTISDRILDAYGTYKFLTPAEADQLVKQVVDELGTW
jgi:hypothetical protein